MDPLPLYSEKVTVSVPPKLVTRVRTTGKTQDLINVGEFTIACGSDKRARMWNWQTGKPRRTFKGHTGPVTSMAIDKERKRLYTGSWDGHVIVWTYSRGSGAKGAESASESHQQTPPTVPTPPSTKISDAKSKCPYILMESPKPEGPAVFLKSLCLDATGDVLFAGFGNGRICAFKTSDMTIIPTSPSMDDPFFPHTNSVNSISLWYPNGKASAIPGENKVGFPIVMVSVSSDRTVSFTLVNPCSDKYFVQLPTKVGSPHAATVWAGKLIGQSETGAFKVEPTGKAPTIASTCMMVTTCADKAVRGFRLEWEGTRNQEQIAAGMLGAVEAHLVWDKMFEDWILNISGTRNSEDNRVVAYLSGRDGNAYEFDVKDGTLIRSWRAGVGHCSAVSIATIDNPYLPEKAETQDASLAEAETAPKKPMPAKIDVLVGGGTEEFLTRQRLTDIDFPIEEEGELDEDAMMDDPALAELEDERFRAMLESDIHGHH